MFPAGLSNADIEQAVSALKIYDQIPQTDPIYQCATTPFPTLSTAPGPETSVAPVCVLLPLFSS